MQASNQMVPTTNGRKRNENRENIQVLLCRDTCLTVEVCRHHIEPARLMQDMSTDYSLVKSPLSVSVDEEGKEIKSSLYPCMCWCSSTPTKFQQQTFSIFQESNGNRDNNVEFCVIARRGFSWHVCLWLVVEIQPRYVYIDSQSESYNDLCDVRHQNGISDNISCGDLKMSFRWDAPITRGVNSLWQFPRST